MPDSRPESRPQPLLPQPLLPSTRESAPLFDPVPVLTGGRVLLSGHRLADFPDSFALWSDATVQRFGGRVLTEEEVWQRLCRSLRHWLRIGYGHWAIRERATGRVLGEVGLLDSRSGLGPHFDGQPEIGWALAGWAQGQGFATEAARLALAWADAHLAASRTVCLIHRDHMASLSLAARLGYAEYGRAEYRGDPVILFERPRGVQAVAAENAPDSEVT